jgi:hypothetical protein
MTPNTDAPPDRMTVTVRDRSAEAPWGSGLTNPCVVKVEISARCPVCQGPRGEPSTLRQHEDGVTYWTDTWANPCGHTDPYAAVVTEAKALGGPRLPVR